MNWYIGQRIVAIKNHNRGLFKKNDEFTIKGLQTSRCHCPGIEINIGISTEYPMCCLICGWRTLETGIRWFGEWNFAPLDVDISELTDILKEPIKQNI